MKKIKFRTQWKSDPAKGCPVYGPVLTVPDMNYSIRDILTKFTRIPEIALQNMAYDYDENANESDYDFDSPTVRDFNDLSDLSAAYNELDRFKNAQKVTAPSTPPAESAGEVPTPQ